MCAQPPRAALELLPQDVEVHVVGLGVLDVDGDDDEATVMLGAEARGDHPGRRGIRLRSPGLEPSLVGSLPEGQLANYGPGPPNVRTQYPPSSEGHCRSTHAQLGHHLA